MICLFSAGFSSHFRTAPSENSSPCSTDSIGFLSAAAFFCILGAVSHAHIYRNQLYHSSLKELNLREFHHLGPDRPTWGSQSFRSNPDLPAIRFFFSACRAWTVAFWPPGAARFSWGHRGFWSYSSFAIGLCCRTAMVHGGILLDPRPSSQSSYHTSCFACYPKIAAEYSRWLYYARQQPVSAITRAFHSFPGEFAAFEPFQYRPCSSVLCFFPTGETTSASGVADCESRYSQEIQGRILDYRERQSFLCRAGSHRQAQCCLGYFAHAFLKFWWSLSFGHFTDGPVADEPFSA